ERFDANFAHTKCEKNNVGSVRFWKGDEFHGLIRERKLYHGRFCTYFRMSMNQLEALLQMLAPDLGRTNFREPIDPEQRPAVSASYRLGVSTVGKMVKDISNVIWEQMRETFLPSPSEDLWKNTARRFQERWNFPNYIGGLDGKHVVIQAPASSGSQFHYDKGTFSVDLLVQVDTVYRFLAVDVGAFGSNSNGGILANSRLGRDLQSGVLHVPLPSPLPSAPELGPVPFVTVGDEAFPMKPYLLRPYPGQGIPEEMRIFNYRLSRARQIYENAFLSSAGEHRMQVCPDTADGIIKASCILCNYLRPEAHHQGEEDMSRDEVEDDSVIGPIRSLRGNQASAEALRVRDTFRNYFLSPNKSPQTLPHGETP
uniref:DDE Tnp4 domain-containing protein n=1 Tax=Esox lucius TaxID=8010 RepID=A0A3P8ZZU2_ESOLU